MSRKTYSLKDLDALKRQLADLEKAAKTEKLKKETKENFMDYAMKSGLWEKGFDPTKG